MAGTSWWRRRWLWALLIVVAVIAAWVPKAYRASDGAKNAIVSDSRVQVEFANGVYEFTPMSYRSAVPVGLLIYPETLVDPIAYAPYARAIAAAGYPVILAPLAERGVLSGSDPAATMHTSISAVNEDERAAQWIMSGHGGGATLAARTALELLNLGAKSVGGLLMIGTTEPHDSVLMHVKIPMAKVVGTADLRARFSKAEAQRRFLPPQTVWTAIAGGNHSQFASAGWLPGDWFASISRAEQQQQLVNATLDMLRSASETQRNAGWLAR